MNEEVASPLINCILTYEKSGRRYEKTAAVLYSDMITFNAPGFSSSVKLNSFSGISAMNYRVTAKAEDCDIVLSMIGHLYEDFSIKFVRAFNEVVYKESLMLETAHFEADGQYVSPDNITCHAVFRICETAVVILPDTHGLVRIPYCMFAKAEIAPYRFTVTDRFGRVFVMMKMGMLTDPFLKAYETSLSELLKETREHLSTIAPVSDDLASLLMEGMVARLSEVRRLNPRFADAVDEKLSASEIAEEYKYLKSVSSEICIGIKRGLMGDLTGETILIIAPVFEKNVMIMESLGDTAAATYIYRISNDGKADPSEWDTTLLNFNYSMLSVNFRREPIYLSNDALKTENYEKYAMALSRIPELKQIRSLFLGRAIHNGFDSWKKAIESYIK